MSDLRNEIKALEDRFLEDSLEIEQYFRQTEGEGLRSSQLAKGLFTWSGGPQSSGVGFFCFHALGDTKQKKPTPLDRGPPLHVNRV